MQIFAHKKFENPIKIIQAFDNKSFIQAFAQIEDFKRQNKYYILGYIRYEAKEIFLGQNIKSNMPLLYFEVFNNPSPQPSPPRGEGEFLHSCNISPTPLIEYKTYKTAIEKIKDEIACGNTYQVNYTYDYKIETDLSGFDLYNSILPNQTTPYNAYIKNEYEEILCFSPELFFEIQNNKIKTKPMKGTVKRGENKEQDKKNIEFLKNDIKNRAENVMIVDLLRNDLGKIAKTGTVKVDKLFEIETHKTVHQMTSEVSAELDEKTTLFEVFDAIFPCGSITGAPKINTMKIIDELEGVGQRNVYCGAIGLISPEKIVFSVPIRILQRSNNEKFFLCRVGGAIVWDSTPEEEWEETLTKIKFLNNNVRHCETTAEAIQEKSFGLSRRAFSAPRNDEARIEMSDYPNNNIELIETILVKNTEMVHKNEHFKRMKKSAKELGFVFNPEIEKIKPQSDGILRILLSKDGLFTTQYLPLDEIKTNKVTISEIKLNSQETFLKHKTTYRPWYEKALEKIKKGEIFDELFFNEKGELCEGSRSNIVLQIDDKLFTPPLKCGLLNGVLRQRLLHSNKGFKPIVDKDFQSKKIKEEVIYLKDLKNAQKVFCINSVRGIVEVEIKWEK